MTDPGLVCGCPDARLQAASASGNGGRRDAATPNVTDLRRARQRARATFRDLVDVIIRWLERNDVATYFNGAGREQRLNQLITELAAQHIRQELLSWLDDRRRTTMARGFRAAFDAMRQVANVGDGDLIGQAAFTNADIGTARVLANVDAGLLVDNSDSLASDVGDRVTRQLRLGVRQNESVQDLGRRVELIIDDGDGSDRQEKGVTGQTTRSKGELIAHDAVQDAHNTAATKRYLRNGFRYGVYDATIDTKTTRLCTRMNEVVIDMVRDPVLVPPNHPYCRSGIRPVLDVDQDDVVGRDDISDDYLQTIFSTAGYRPPVLSDEDFQPTALTEQYGQA